MELKETQIVWEKMLEKLLETTTETEYQRWIVPMAPVSLTDMAMVLGAPRDFSRDYVRDHYLPFLSDAAETVLGKRIEISIETTSGEGKKGEAAEARPD